MTPLRPVSSNNSYQTMAADVALDGAALGGKMLIGLLHVIHSRAGVIIFALVFSCAHNFAKSAISVVGSRLAVVHGHWDILD